MTVHFIRTSGAFYKFWGASSPSLRNSTSTHLGVISAMREFKVSGTSRFCTDICGEQSENSKVVLGTRDESLSSLNAQCTPEIEKKYVHRVYDAIAPHFSSTRFAKWPKVATFLKSLPLGSLVLDAGCGNGKYLGLNPDCFFIGCDISAPLINICADRGHEVVVADALNLPYRSNFGDAAISIAVLHHLSSEIRRKKAIHELIRVVKESGLVLLTVWAVEQEDRSLVNKWTPLAEKFAEEWIGPSSPELRSHSSPTLESIPEMDNSSRQFGGYSNDISIKKLREDIDLTSSRDADLVCCESGKQIEKQQEYFVPWHLPYHRAEVSGASAAAVANGLAKKDDKKGAVVYNRYYHVFGEGELERLVSGMENAVVVDQFYDKSNWCVILKKISPKRHTD